MNVIYKLWEKYHTNPKKKHPNQNVPRVVVFKYVICFLDYGFCALIQLYRFSRPMDFFLIFQFKEDNFYTNGMQ